MNASDTATAEGARARLPGWPALAFAVVGGQAAWAVAFLIAYPTVQIACATDLRILVHLVRWVAAVIAVAATVTGLRSWRAAQAAGGVAPGEHTGDPAPPDEPPRVFATGWRRDAQRAAFLGFAGMLLSGIAVFLLMVEDFATWVIDPCISG